MSELGVTLLLGVVSSVLSSTVVGSIVAFVLKKIDEKDQDKKTSKEADKLLLLDLLKRTAKDHMDNGYISQQDSEIFEATYKCYKACDGDGWADQVLKEVQALPKIEFIKMQNV